MTPFDTIEIARTGFEIIRNILEGRSCCKQAPTEAAFELAEALHNLPHSQSSFGDSAFLEELTKKRLNIFIEKYPQFEKEFNRIGYYSNEAPSIKQAPTEAAFELGAFFRKSSGKTMWDAFNKINQENVYNKKSGIKMFVLPKDANPSGYVNSLLEEDPSIYGEHHPIGYIEIPETTLNPEIKNFIFFGWIVN